jgi:hypothetical protein
MSKTQTKKNDKSAEKPVTKKSSKKEDVEDGEDGETEKKGKNQATTKAKLDFDVNRFKVFMARQYKISDPKSESDDWEKPKFHGGQIALAAANEVLCNYIIKEAINHLSKDKVGLYTLDKNAFTATIKSEPDLKTAFLSLLEVYDPQTNFSDQYCIERKDIDKYIAKNFGENFSLDASGFNLLTYILLKYSSSVTKYASMFVKYAKKTMIVPNSICVASQIRLTEKLNNLVTIKIESTAQNSGMDIYGKSLGKDKNDDDDDDADGEKDDDDKSDKGKKKGGKAKKDAKDGDDKQTKGNKKAGKAKKDEKDDKEDDDTKDDKDDDKDDKDDEKDDDKDDEKDDDKDEEEEKPKGGKKKEPKKTSAKQNK